VFTIKDIIDLAVQIEKNGERFFRQARERVDSGAVRQALDWMAEDEACHGRWFARLGRRMTERDANPHLAEVGRQILTDFLGEQSFSLTPENLKRVGSLKALLQLVQEFERDTVLFYQLLGAAIEASEDVEQLARIVEEERRHERLLAHCLALDTEEAALLALLSSRAPVADG
jgi:rubrerythrin